MALHVTNIKDCLFCSAAREWVAAALFALILSALVYAIWIDTNNPRVTESELRNEAGAKVDVFAPGGTILVYRVACVDRVAPGVVSVELVNLKTGDVYSMGSRSTGAVAGCQSRTLRMQLPDEIIPGVYEYRGVATYQVNPLRTVVFTLPPIRFTVQAKR
jgi:hypothetical protein